MSEPTAGTMRDCTCGHPGALHEWESRVSVGYVHVGPCAWAEQRPPEGDDPRVQYNLCACRKYNPMNTTTCDDKLCPCQDGDPCNHDDLTPRCNHYRACGCREAPLRDWVGRRVRDKQYKWEHTVINAEYSVCITMPSHHTLTLKNDHGAVHFGNPDSYELVDAPSPSEPSMRSDS